MLPAISRSPSLNHKGEVRRGNAQRIFSAADKILKAGIGARGTGDRLGGPPLRSFLSITKIVPRAVPLLPVTPAYAAHFEPICH